MPNPDISSRDIIALSGQDARREWLTRLLKVSGSLLDHAASGQLRAGMPVECKPGWEERTQASSHLEAVGRMLAGLAPWLSREPNDLEEKKQWALAVEKTVAMFRYGLDPKHPDAFDFVSTSQAVVDAAFLAQGLIRCFDVVWPKLTSEEKAKLIAGLRKTRRIRPPFNNWLLFSAIIEAFFHLAGEEDWDRMRIDYAVRQHLQWYLGDGIYGDGPNFHWDYYNSFVIQPMLLEVLEVVEGKIDYEKETLAARKRSVRYAEVQERLLAMDGSFPPLGRSLAYRCGAFQLLALQAWREQLPESLTAAQVRSALTAVIFRTLDAPGTFDKEGWLRIGLCGHQPEVGERYISTGSLYLSTEVFLPLGLPESSPFWKNPGEPWTACQAWSGQSIQADSDLYG